MKSELDITMSISNISFFFSFADGLAVTPGAPKLKGAMVIAGLCHIPFICPSHLRPSSPTLRSQDTNSALTRHKLHAHKTQTPESSCSECYSRSLDLHYIPLFTSPFLYVYIHTSSCFIHSSNPVPGCVHCSSL